MPYKICVYVPDDDSVERVKQALFSAGAGQIGDYSSCAFETRGMGQFKPLVGAKPAIGKVGALEQVAEVRIELVCEEPVIKAAVTAMLEAHPYEEPAYQVLPFLRLQDLS